MEEESIFKDMCEYYEASRKKNVLENQEAFARFEEIGCYGCPGIDTECYLYNNRNINTTT